MKNKKILISIKPKFVEKILSGDKKYEYRTKRPKTNINTMLIYCTSPTMKIVAEASIEHIICGTPNKIWKMTNEKSGIQQKDFFKYFSGKKMAYAYKLNKITKFNAPRKLKYYGITHPPQSFQFLK